MRKILTFTAAALLAASAFAAGEVYRWKDADGTWHYSDQPHPGAELVRRSARTPGDVSGASDDSSAPAPSQTIATSDAAPVSPEVAQQVRSEAAAAKSEQCQKAQEAYDNAVKARRIYKVDEKGNRVYLNDAEIDAKRMEARAQRDLACG